MIESFRYFLLLYVAAIIFGSLFACQTLKKTKGTNQFASNKAENSNQIVTEKADKSVDSSLSTPTESYKTAFAARRAKDVTALRRVFSKDLIEFFGKMGAVDHKSLDDELTELVQKPQAATAEVRNETINNDRAVIEYLDENGKWQPMEFVKEGVDWKMTLGAKPLPNPEKTINNKK